jgi:transposase-like protein
MLMSDRCPFCENRNRCGVKGKRVYLIDFKDGDKYVCCDCGKQWPPEKENGLQGQANS